MSVKKLIAGNWKMNGVGDSLAEAEAVAAALSAETASCDAMICPPFTLITRMATSLSGGPVSIGAQDCHSNDSGAHTGDISAGMLKEAGCSAVIVGHSERRADHAETDTLVKSKAEAALGQGLTAIVCVGETEAQRDAGEAVSVTCSQVEGSLPDGATPANTIIAYEPVWAIGTGRTPTPDDVAEMHAAIRSTLVDRLGVAANEMRILYGGSVKPGNAAELMAIANVDGALVGGASLKADDFLGVIRATPA